MKTRTFLAVGSWIAMAGAAGCAGTKSSVPAAAAPPESATHEAAPIAGVANPQPAISQARADAPAPADTTPVAAVPPASTADATPEVQVPFVWNEKPALSQAPGNGVFVSIGGRTVKARHFEIDFDPKAGVWRLETDVGDGTGIGPTLTFAGEPKVGTTTQRMGANGATFQVPVHGTTAARSDETTAVTPDCASIVQITSVEAPRGRGIDGHVSGRFVAVFKPADDRQLWAAGTFTAAPYVKY